MKVKPSRIWIAVLLGAALAVPALSVVQAKGKKMDHGKHDAHKHGGQKAKGRVVVKKGEIVDMHCYMSHEGKGKKHAKCAEKCVLGGAPMGLLTDDGTVYLLAEDHSKKVPYNKVKELAAKRVQITGKMFTRGGLSAIVVHKVKKL
ncbi:MAG: hypothetical protein V3S11_05400 [Elusimicrobiota bacterium]